MDECDLQQVHVSTNKKEFLILCTTLVQSVNKPSSHIRGNNRGGGSLRWSSRLHWEEEIHEMSVQRSLSPPPSFTFCCSTATLPPLLPPPSPPPSTPPHFSLSVLRFPCAVSLHPSLRPETRCCSREDQRSEIRRATTLQMRPEIGREIRIDTAQMRL